MKSCYNCLFSQSMTPSLWDTSCNLICEQYSYTHRKWIIVHPVLRALFCKKYFNRDEYLKAKEDCFWTCKYGKTPQCPNSAECLAIGRPYFKLKEEYAHGRNDL